MGNFDWVQGSSELLQGKQFEIYKPNDNPLSILVPTKQKDSFVTNSNFSKPFSLRKFIFYQNGFHVVLRPRFIIPSHEHMEGLRNNLQPKQS
jgi:hypothetical protein